MNLPMNLPMSLRARRKWMVCGILAATAAGTALILMAFQENLLYFYTPQEVAAGEAPSGRDFRVGGLVVKDSVWRDKDSLAVRFAVTDLKREIVVLYEGVLPDLFREEQGIIANGRLREDGVFQASQVLAKHDENYMPPEVADALGISTAKPP